MEATEVQTEEKTKVCDTIVINRCSKQLESLELPERTAVVNYLATKYLPRESVLTVTN